MGLLLFTFWNGRVIYDSRFDCLFFSTRNISLQTDIAQGSGGGRREDTEEL